MIDVAQLTSADFLRYVSDDFVAVLNDGTQLPLKLSKVEVLSKSPQAGMRDAFRLLFHGPLEPIAAQQVVTLQHSVIGELELFVVPIGQSDEFTSYECILC